MSMVTDTSPLDETAGVRAVTIGSGLVVLEITGELDLRSVPVVAAQVAAAGDPDTDTDHGPDRAPLVLDLDRVSFLGSAAIAMLLQIQSDATRARRHLHLVIADGNRPVRRTLAGIGLLDQFAIHPDHAHLMADLG